MDVIEDRLVAFCRKEAFKKFVRQAVNDELFRKQMLEDFRIDAKIENQVNERVVVAVRDYLRSVLDNKVINEVSRQLPNAVEDSYQLQRIVSEHQVHVDSVMKKQAVDITRQINESRAEVTAMIDSHSSEMKRQDRQFKRMMNEQQTAMTKQDQELRRMVDDQNSTVAKLISANESVIRDRVQETVKEVIEKIIGEEGYHEINKAYFTAFTEKGDAEIQTLKKQRIREIQSFQNDRDQALEVLRAEKENELQEVQERCQTELQVMRDEGKLAIQTLKANYRESLKELQDDLMTVQKNLNKMDRLQSELRNMKVMLGGMCAFMILGISFIMANF